MGVKAYVDLLEERNIKIPAWIAFNSKDGVNVVSGDSLFECVSIAESCNKVVAVGINCTPPRFILGLILSIRKVCFAKKMYFGNKIVVILVENFSHAIRHYNYNSTVAG